MFLLVFFVRNVSHKVFVKIIVLVTIIIVILIFLRTAISLLLNALHWLTWYDSVLRPYPTTIAITFIINVFIASNLLILVVALSIQSTSMCISSA
jgi:hypothetical protein